MKNLLKNICALSLAIFLLGCNCEEHELLPCGENLTNSAFCGWTVSTCYGGDFRSGIIPSAAVGVIYDTRFNSTAPRGEDWGPTINTVHPANWTSEKMGQVFGIAIDDKENIYLASSDIYIFDGNWTSIALPSGNVNRPFPCGQIFKCSAPNWDPIPFANLPNSCDEGNGVGNIVYDKWNDQFFATNLDDGKIYRIDKSGNILDTYDPWLADSGASGIVDGMEQIWGIAIANHTGNASLYFARVVNPGLRQMFKLDLIGGAFPPIGSEQIAIPQLPVLQGMSPGLDAIFVDLLISDIAFSSDDTKMLIAERGYPHNAYAHSYELVNGTWVLNQNSRYNIGWQTANNRQNCAGGLDFAYNDQQDCDEFFYVTTNYAITRYFAVDERLYGIQGINYSGNNSSEMPRPNANQDTDIFIDYNGIYSTDDKETPGDVEVFDCVECEDPCRLNDLVN